MQEFHMAKEMLAPGPEFHEPGTEIYNYSDEFTHGLSCKKSNQKKSMVNAKKLFYLLAGSATIASIGLLAK